MDAENVVLSTNVRTRQDGLPYANFAQPDDPGVAVYFSLDGEPRAIACDAWEKVEENVRAVGRTLENLRGNDRYRCSEIRKRTFSGFKQLPENGTEPDLQRAYEVLGIEPPVTYEEAEQAYTERVKDAHPDRGGSTEEFQRVRNSWERVKDHHFG